MKFTSSLITVDFLGEVRKLVILPPIRWRGLIGLNINVGAPIWLVDCVGSTRRLLPSMPVRASVSTLLLPVGVSPDSKMGYRLSKAQFDSHV